MLLASLERELPEPPESSEERESELRRPSSEEESLSSTSVLA